MTYETMDWKLEARRVARAFGLSEECQFVERNSHFSREDVVNPHPSELKMRYYELIWQNGEKDAALPVADSPLPTFRCGCDMEAGFMYSIMCSLDSGKLNHTYICFGWDRKVRVRIAEHRHALLLSRGLFHLDLLPPEIEKGLKVTVTAHEKLEWVREFEEHYGL